MNAPKNLCHKCQHFYEDDGDWGCFLFGPEAENCPSLHDDDDADITEIGCDLAKRKLEFLAHRRNEKLEHWNRADHLDFKRRKPYTAKEKDKYGYKAYFHDDACSHFYTLHYRENMKGGHTYNHFYNAGYTATFGHHSLRRIPRDRKSEWVRICKEHYRKEWFINAIERFYMRGQK